MAASLLPSHIVRTASVLHPCCICIASVLLRAARVTGELSVRCAKLAMTEIASEGAKVTQLVDLYPATSHLAALLASVTDEQLSARTPCEKYALGDLIDHINGLSLGFTAAATKEFGESGSQAPSGDASRLDPNWRTAIPERLRSLAAAWRDPDAWDGMTKAGGIDLPAAIAGQVALNEVVVHGWDVALASGQDFLCGTEQLQACLAFLEPTAAPGQEASRADIYGPVVEVGESATPLERLIGLAGRNPDWEPTSP